MTISISSALMVLLICSTWLTAPGVMTQRKRVWGGDKLRLYGFVDRLERDDDPQSIGITGNLQLTFKNVGNKTLIIYTHDLWLGAVSLARTVEEARANTLLLDRSAWPSVWSQQSRKRLFNDLNKDFPPHELTRVLQPGESWSYRTAVNLAIDKTRHPGTTGRTWDEIKNSSPVWLQVMVEMWPVNVEPTLDPDNPAFGLMLRERWKTTGELWLDYLTSEPIAIDFRRNLTALR